MIPMNNESSRNCLRPSCLEPLSLLDGLLWLGGGNLEAVREFLTVFGSRNGRIPGPERLDKALETAQKKDAVLAEYARTQDRERAVRGHGISLATGYRWERDRLLKRRPLKKVSGL